MTYDQNQGLEARTASRGLPVSPALNISKTGGFERAIFDQRTFLAFGAHQHIQGLQLGRYRASSVLCSSFSAIRMPPPAGRR